MGFVNFFQYSRGRILSKIILLAWATAISSFSMTSVFLMILLRFDIGFEIRNWLAISGFIILFFFLKDDLITAPIIPFLDKTISKYAYYVLLGLLAIAVSSISFPLMNNLLNISFFGYPLIAIRNLISIALLVMIRIIHISA